MTFDEKRSLTMKINDDDHNDDGDAFCLDILSIIFVSSFPASISNLLDRLMYWAKYTDKWANRIYITIVDGRNFFFIEIMNQKLRQSTAVLYSNKNIISFPK